MNERFQFLRTYLDSLEKLEKADKELSRELAWKILQYGIKGEDEDTGNPIIEAMFVQIKVMIDKGRDITEKRRKANSERTNIKQKENKKEQKLTKDEQNLTNNEQTTPKDKIENRKDKKENNINNKLTLISESKDSQSYGNEEVNKCLTLIKSYNHGILNGSDSSNRRSAWNLINKLKKFDSVIKGQYERDEVLEGILAVISNNDFYRGKIGSPKLIFDNLGTLVQICGKESKKLQGDTTLELI